MRSISIALSLRKSINPSRVSERSVISATSLAISEPSDSEDFTYELKLDGIRCLAYLWDDGIELINKRNKSLNSIYPELEGIYHCRRWIAATGF